jgi:hypothetical protein
MESFLVLDEFELIFSNAGTLVGGEHENLVFLGSSVLIKKKLIIFERKKHYQKG